MPDYRNMYFRLAARVADAVELLVVAQLADDDAQADAALELLVEAQLEGEDAYMESVDSENDGF